MEKFGLDLKLDEDKAIGHICRSSDNILLWSFNDKSYALLSLGLAIANQISWLIATLRPL